MSSRPDDLGFDNQIIAGQQGTYRHLTGYNRANRGIGSDAANGRAKASAIGIPPVTDVQHDDLRMRVIDHVADAVLATERPPVPLKRLA
jgi:hypothetical protein